jgi:hypothetical protein
MFHFVGLQSNSISLVKSLFYFNIIPSVVFGGGFKGDRGINCNSVGMTVYEQQQPTASRVFSVEPRVDSFLEFVPESVVIRDVLELVHHALPLATPCHQSAYPGLHASHIALSTTCA